MCGRVRVTTDPEEIRVGPDDYNAVAETAGITLSDLQFDEMRLDTHADLAGTCG